MPGWVFFNLQVPSWPSLASVLCQLRNFGKALPAGRQVILTDLSGHPTCMACTPRRDGGFDAIVTNTTA